MNEIIIKEKSNRDNVDSTYEIHKMRLNKEPFSRIKEGKKTIELRINDEKRQLLEIGDLIELTNRTTLENMLVEIEEICKYASFEELYKHFDKISMGYLENEIADYKDMEQYYSKKIQNQYGVVAIKMVSKSNPDKEVKLSNERIEKFSQKLK